jgi:hypothetical protein
MATKDVTTSGTFTVTATNNNVTSSPLVVTLTPSITSISLSYHNTSENPTHALSFGGSEVVIQADVVHSKEDTDWDFVIPTALSGKITSTIRSNYITFRITNDNTTVDSTSFLVTAENGGAIASISVYIQKTDQNATAVVVADTNPSGIVWQNNKDYSNAPHIKTPV